MPPRGNWCGSFAVCLFLLLPESFCAAAVPVTADQNARQWRWLWRSRQFQAALTSSNAGENSFLRFRPWVNEAKPLGAFGLIAAMLSAAGLLAVRRLRNRASAPQESPSLAQERERIAKDLHDEVGAALTHIALTCDLVVEDQDPAQRKRRLRQIAFESRRTVESMDEIVWTLNPKNDDLPHLVGYLNDYAAEFLTPTGIRLEAKLPEELPKIPLTSEQRHNVLMALKEALNNTAKHSGATRLSLKVGLQNNILRIELADNGKGFRAEATLPGQGLGNMRQRLEASGGELQLTSRPGQGAVVSIALNLPRCGR